MLTWYSQGRGHWTRRVFPVTFSLVLLMVPSILFAIFSIQTYLYLTDFMVGVLGMKFVDDVPIAPPAPDSPVASQAAGEEQEQEQSGGRKAGVALRATTPKKRASSRGRTSSSAGESDGGQGADASGGTPATRSQSRRRTATPK
jgi:hypothetical protein